MATKISAFLNSITGVFQSGNKPTRENKPIEPVKHYTFMIRGEGMAKHVNIIAPDKASAEQNLREQFPTENTYFLWEYVRSSPAA